MNKEHHNFKVVVSEELQKFILNAFLSAIESHSKVNSYVAVDSIAKFVPIMTLDQLQIMADVINSLANMEDSDQDKPDDVIIETWLVLEQIIKKAIITKERLNRIPNIDDAE